MHPKPFLNFCLAVCLLCLPVMGQGLILDDYMEAAWSSTRFFGAQRSGLGPNWVGDGTTYPTSFTGDNHNGIDVSGGWFDCGDHVMFGQPQSVASYVLAVSYENFTTGYHDLYHGDYSDYKSSGNYTRAGGRPNGIPDLLEELRYQADYLVKASISSTAFVHRKGDGNADHSRWVTPGRKSTLARNLGGEPRDIIVDAADGFTPGMFAAMLAVMARVDPEPARRQAYLAAAERAYSYAKRFNSVADGQTFYQAAWWSGRWADGPFLAALELWRTTQNATYRSEAESYFDQLEIQSGSYTRFAYANVIPLSIIMAEKYLNLLPTQSRYEPLAVLNQLYNSQKNAQGAFTRETGGGGSFSVRSPAGGAFLYALYSVLHNTSVHDSIIFDQVDFLLGQNPNRKSYLVGFNRGNSISPPAPHHRGYYGNEDPNRNETQVTAPVKNHQLGGLIAGAFSDATHNTNVSTWNINEVCVDINAPFVGAMGYVMSKLQPTGSSLSTGGLPSPQALGFTIAQQGREYHFRHRDGNLRVRIFTLQGLEVANLTGENLQWTPPAGGVYTVQLRSAEGQFSTAKLSSL